VVRVRMVGGEHVRAPRAATRASVEMRQALSRVRSPPRPVRLGAHQRRVGESPTVSQPPGPSPPGTSRCARGDAASCRRHSGCPYREGEARTWLRQPFSLLPGPMLRMSTWTSRIPLTFLAFAASVKPGLAAHARNTVSASLAEAVGSKRSR
jgi:hypothetical protein